MVSTVFLVHNQRDIHQEPENIHKFENNNYTGLAKVQ